MEKEKQNELLLPEWIFQEPIESEVKIIYKPKPLKQVARDNIKLDDKQLNEELAKKMNSLFYFTDRNLKVGFKINLDTHHINHANSKLTITPNYPEIEMEVRCLNKIIKGLSVIYARLLNQYKFQYQTAFSARFDKQDEDIQILDETELFNNLNINHNLTEGDLDDIDVRPPLEHQIQQQEMEESGWRFDKIKSMTKYFTKEVN